MLPIIMDSSFVKLAVIDDYISFIWTARYYTAGDFELVVPVSYASIVAQDYYVLRDDDDNVGIIEDVKMQHTEDGNDILIISGRFLSSILARRIIGAQTTVSGKVSACINTLLTDNIINPFIAARRISNFTLGSYDIATTMKAQYTGANLLEVVSEICETYGIGFKVTLNSSNQYVFTLYTGTDHTYDQQVNPWIIFSDKYDNLASADYEECYQQITTAALVAGEGEGSDRITLWVTDGATGLNRHESFVDRRDIQSNNGAISSADYQQLLQQAGEEALTRYTSAFVGNVYFDNIKYKQDINLGDLCVIENSSWGIYINARLVEVIESVSEAGEYSIIPTFGI